MHRNDKNNIVLKNSHTYSKELIAIFKSRKYYHEPKTRIY